MTTPSRDPRLDALDPDEPIWQQRDTRGFISVGGRSLDACRKFPAITHISTTIGTWLDADTWITAPDDWPTPKDLRVTKESAACRDPGGPR